jgi:V/A-type H+-transporting ATPase subunit D
MEQLTATRSELLVRRAQIALATQGRDVLKEKRDQLMGEFRKTADVVLAGGAALEAAAAAGRRSLARAEAGDGIDVVAAAASARPSDIVIESHGATVMGVRIADIRHEPVGRSPLQRGYGLATTSARIDTLAADFEAEIALLLDLAVSELRLRRLVEEIRQTTRRVNALESILLPRLEAERLHIQAVLDERERQDRFRMKRFITGRGTRLAEGVNR